MKIVLIILIICLLLCLAVLIFFLVSPLKVLIDSKNGLLIIGWNRWIHARICEEAELWYLNIKLPFWKRQYSLLKLLLLKRQNASKIKEKEKSKLKGMYLGSNKVLRVFRKIKFKELKIILDTDDYMWNAYLTPLFELFSFKTGHQTHINFMGKNEIKIYAESRIINMVMAGIF